MLVNGESAGKEMVDYCATHHPVSSVFIPYYDPKWVDATKKYSNIFVEGYVIPKNDILDVLEGYGVKVQKKSTFRKTKT